MQKTIKKGARHSDGELAERVRASLTEAHKKWQRETQTALQKLETDLRQHFKHTTTTQHRPAAPSRAKFAAPLSC